MSRHSAIRCRLAWAMAAASIVLVAPEAVAQGTLPAGFAYLRDVDPSIAQDIRYAGSDNFIGRPLAGYDAAECILRRDVALALKRVQAGLAAAGLGLKVYDCYRPERAVRAMVHWAMDGRAAGAGKRFFPRLEKRNLFAGYLSARSRHSTGTAVDVTLVQSSGPPVSAFEPSTAYAPCTAPVGQREPDDSVDMGTGYDCLDVNSHTATGSITAEQRRWRSTLVAAMTKHGFRNYFREWWHFSYAGGTPATYHDFPIRPPPPKRAPD